jgi:hypothetical protein
MDILWLDEQISPWIFQDLVSVTPGRNIAIDLLLDSFKRGHPWERIPVPLTMDWKLNEIRLLGQERNIHITFLYCHCPFYPSH